MKSLNKLELLALKPKSIIKILSVSIDGRISDPHGHTELYILKEKKLNSKNEVVLCFDISHDGKFRPATITLNKSVNQKGEKSIYSSGSKTVWTFELIRK